MYSSDVPPMVESRNSIPNTLRRWMYSRYYFAFYIVMLGFSVFSLVFAFADTVDTSAPWFVVLEVIINSIMVLEVVLRIVAWGKRYFHQFLNVIDLVVVFSCFVSFILFFIDKPEAYIYAALLCVRYAVQIVQFVRFYIRQRAVQRSKASIVDFSATLPTSSEELVQAYAD